jgi:hypothetical protein
MKKTLLFIITIFITSSILYAEETAKDKTVVPREKNVFTNPSDNEFIGKLGTGYASDPGKFGLDLSLNYIYNLDPVFVFGFEADFFWVKWKNELSDVNAGGAANGSLTAETNLYTFPLFANAQVRFPFLKSKIYVEPSITVGLGYCFMILDYSSDTDSGTDLYSGFAWQTFASFSYKIFEKSAVDFVLDIGYRDITPSRDRVEIDMSGVFTRLGVRMFI